MTNDGAAGLDSVEVPNFAIEAEETIPARLERWASEPGDRQAVLCGERAIGWAELGRRMDAIARGLRAIGCGSSSKVGVLAENSIDYVAIILGAVRAGCVIVPLPCLMSEDTLARLARDAGLSCLAATARYRDLAGRVGAASGALQSDGLVAIDFEAPGWLALDELERRGAAGPVVERVAPDTPFNIIYSSGTTGVPKGIVQDHRTRASQTSGFSKLGCDRQCAALISTPLYANFSFGAVLLALWGGGRVLLMDKFREESFLDLCRIEAPTHAFIVPVQLDRLLAHPDFDKTAGRRTMLKYVAGSPLREETKRETVRRWPGPLVEVYGMTEGGAVTALFAHEHPDKLASVGHVVGGGELLIIDEEGRVLPPGETGEIVGVSVPSMSGYHNRRELSEELIWLAPNGRSYLRSGDLGYLDKDGFLYLNGRKKDVIISGGLNIYATDLEEVTARHPDVLEATVIGVPSERFGESPLALVVLKPEADVNPESVLAWVNQRLGKAQRLSGLEVRANLPRGAIGKVLKAELRAPYWAS